MKKHYVNIRYKVSFMDKKQYYIFQGLVNEVLNEKGKPIVYPQNIFKQAFGFVLPPHSTISIF